MSTTPPVELLTPADVAKALKVGVVRVYRLIRSGDLPSVHLGRQVRVDATALREWTSQGGSKSHSGSGSLSKARGSRD